MSSVTVGARILQNRTVVQVVNVGRNFSTTRVQDGKHYKLVVVGGGNGGCAVSARACRTFGKGTVAVIEPAKLHFYQPYWTLVGAGLKKVQDSWRNMEDVLPKGCDHHKHRAVEFDPENNTVTMDNGEQLSYDFMLVAMGIQINWNKVDGLLQALKRDPLVCSNFSRDTVVKTFPAIQKIGETGGRALFTFPNTTIKCAGAPQKVMYLADANWRKHGQRDKVHVEYNTSLPVIFGVPRYAKPLMEIIKNRDINVNYRRNLVAVDYKKKEATFELLDSTTGEKEVRKYDMLHVAPPMSAPDILKNSKSSLVDETGYLDVSRATLQHKKFPNIFGIGDCTNVPTAKTAAAVGSQNVIALKGIKEMMSGQEPSSDYDGYTSCPLLTGNSKCILAEFGFDGSIIETFPFAQDKERRTMFHLKKDFMPHIYWQLALNGRWRGTSWMRKLMHLGMGK